MIYPTLFFASLAAAAWATATNNWTEPCLDGVCSYDLPASAGSSSGTLKVWGSKDAISDITPAAGWEILDCAPDVLSQDIRLICKSEDATACAHLYGAAGAEGKIVRLPESCGKSAFARVARAYVPTDQSIPAAIARRVIRRDGRQPQVKGLALDTNFSAVDSSRTGAVNFAIKGANVPGADGNIDTSTVGPQRRSRIYRRGPLGNRLGFVGDTINGFSSFNKNKSSTLPPLDVDKKSTLFNKTLVCSPNAASINVDVDAKAHAVATIGVAASGTLIPPKIDDFAITISLTADIDGSVNLNANIAGTIDSGKIHIFEAGVPGLDFPGVLTLGPNLEVDAQVTATLELEVGLDVGINYHIEGAELVFPPNSQSQGNGGSFQINDTPLKLSANPSVKATGTITAHLIPSINLEVSALGSTAGIFLELDASADMQLSLEAQTEVPLAIAKTKREAVPTVSEGLEILFEHATASPTTIIPVHDVRALRKPPRPAPQHGSGTKATVATTKHSTTNVSVGSKSTLSTVPETPTTIVTTLQKLTSVVSVDSKNSLTTSSVQTQHETTTTTTAATQQTTSIISVGSKNSLTTSSVQTRNETSSSTTAATQQATSIVSVSSKNPLTASSIQTQHVTSTSTTVAAQQTTRIVSADPGSSSITSTIQTGHETLTSTATATQQASSIVSVDSANVSTTSTVQTEHNTSTSTSEVTQQASSIVSSNPGKPSITATIQTEHKTLTTTTQQATSIASVDPENSSITNIPSTNHEPSASTSTTTQPPTSSNSASTTSSGTTTSSITGSSRSSAAAPSATGATNGGFSGCFEIGAGLDVNAGADADLFGLFDKGTQISLFSKKFQIFKKCFGNNAKRSFPRFPRRLHSQTKRELTCPTSGGGVVASVVDETISAASIAAV